MKHMMLIGTSPQFPLHTVRQCNCGRWGCITKRSDEVMVKFSYNPRPEYYTSACAADALRDDVGCIEWVRMSEPTRRRMEQERTAEAAMVGLFAEVAS